MDDYTRSIALSAGIPSFPKTKRVKSDHRYADEWSPHDERRLIYFHRRGYSFEDIASQLGGEFTRNSVAGKVRRLKNAGVLA